MSLRRRNKLHSMRLVQAAAIDLFEVQGYGLTTVEAVAARCGVSASTIYRHFGSKEHLVLWDERDDVIDDELSRRLVDQDPLEAIRDAAITAFAHRDDPQLFLRRLRLVYAEPDIWAAAALQDRLDRADLASAIASAAGRRSVSVGDDVIAATCLAALDVAFDHWQRSNGAEGLAEMIALACQRPV